MTLEHSIESNESGHKRLGATLQPTTMSERLSQGHYDLGNFGALVEKVKEEKTGEFH